MYASPVVCFVTFIVLSLRKINHTQQSTEEYKVKIAELRALGGDQILLQGGLHPEL